MTYTIKGRDNDGDFEGSRRYKDFDALRSYLVKNWPGIYIPFIPPKQSFGNKNEKFVENRMYFLNRFLKKIGETNYLLNSEEFRCFARPSGDVRKTFAMLQQTTPSKLLERLENEVGISPLIEDSMFKRCREESNEFAAFLKRIVSVLKVIKDQAERMVEIKEVSNYRSQTMINVMKQYENGGLTRFVNQDTSKLVIDNSQAPDIKDK